MNAFKNILEKQLFLALQEGVEISENPLKSIEEKLHLRGDEILALYSSFVERGLVRRFGAVFEPSKLGYQSILCAAKIVNSESIKKAILDIKEITHCYTRDYEYNLWFTFTARRAEFRVKLDFIRNIFDSEILELPAVKKFKTEVIFNLGLSVARASRPCLAQNIMVFDADDISIANSLYEMSLSNNMFDNHLLQKLNIWKSCGALKRIGLVPYHKQIGYNANAMCIWKVEADKVDSIGRELSKRASVTHCYERIPIEGKFPYNFFAMIHSETTQKLELEISAINKELKLSNGKILSTVSELKKTSFNPF